MQRDGAHAAPPPPMPAAFENAMFTQKRIPDCLATRRHGPRGFTLVELLVVITIIGVLVGMLLPAVQAAREAGRRAQCANNIKQLALGMQTHLQALGFFPSGGWGYMWTPQPARGAGPPQPGGWGYAVLPYIGQQALYDLGNTVSPTDETSTTLLNANRQRLQTPLSVWHCPRAVSPRFFPSAAASASVSARLCAPMTFSAQNDYVANAGEMVCGLDAAGVEQCGFWSGPPTLASGLNGGYAFPDGLWTTGVTYTRSQVSDVQITDGLSNTYLVGEKSLDPDWYFTGQSYGDDQGPYFADERDGVRWASFGAGTANYLPPTQDRPGSDLSWSFGSAHAGGFNMAMCDGSVRLFSYSISETIHRCLANRSDGQAIDSSKL